jgi:hypothetical protein
MVRHQDQAAIRLLVVLRVFGWLARSARLLPRSQFRQLQ